MSDSRGIVCYCCGERILTSTAYEFHVKKCTAKFSAAQAQGAPARRKPPPEPPGPVPLVPSRRGSADGAAEDALAVYN